MQESYFDHDADIGIIGKGESVETCFVDGARAMFALMGNLVQVHPTQTISISFEESDIELATESSPPE